MISLIAKRVNIKASTNIIYNNKLNTSKLKLN